MFSFDEGVKSFFTPGRSKVFSWTQLSFNLAIISLKRKIDSFESFIDGAINNSSSTLETALWVKAIRLSMNLLKLKPLFIYTKINNLILQK